MTDLGIFIIGSTPGEIEVETRPIIENLVDEVDNELEEAEERRQALLAEARETYDAWRTEKFNQLSAVAAAIMTATEEKEAKC